MHAVTDELHIAQGGVQGGSHHTGGPVAEGRHGVEQMGHLPGPQTESLHRGVIVRRGMGDGHGDFSLHRLNKLHGTRLLRGNGNELDQSLGGGHQAAEHSHVGGVEPRAVLCALFGHGEEGSLQIDAAEGGAGLIGGPMGGGHLTDLGELLLRQGHTGRADLGDPPGELILCHNLQALWFGVGEVPAHAAVEVDVGETGDHIAAGGVIGLSVRAGAREQAAVKADVPLDKALLQVEHLSAGYPHTVTPASTSL